MTVRLATVGPESRTSAVSCGAYSTQSTGTPSSPATICGKTVFVPCPISVFAVRTRRRASAVSSTEATDAR